jgi:hypothetical protein
MMHIIKMSKAKVKCKVNNWKNPWICIVIKNTLYLFIHTHLHGDDLYSKMKNEKEGIRVRKSY